MSDVYGDQERIARGVVEHRLGVEQWVIRAVEWCIRGRNAIADLVRWMALAFASAVVFGAALWMLWAVTQAAMGQWCELHG